jgi:hypothetical protein
MKSHAAFIAATRRPENNVFGCPHHKHEALATLVGLPHAEQTFARRIEVFFPGKPRSQNAISAEMLRRNAIERPDRAEQMKVRRTATGVDSLQARLPSRREPSKGKPASSARQ